MTSIVLIHGIGQQVKGAESLLADWLPALSDGIRHAGENAKPDVSMAFYGNLFRPPGRRGSALPDLDASDVTDPLDVDLLLSWWEEAARHEPAVTGPQDKTRLRTSHTVQRALNALTHSRFFAGLTERVMISDLRQVRRYLTEPDLRLAAQERLAEAVTPDTRVILSHSLGSVVAYETACAHPEWPDLNLITLGSPLGIRNLIFDRLQPPPTTGHARWPAPVRQWTNIADRGDVVALVKELAPTFGNRVVDIPVHNGAKAHDVQPYLTAPETGRALAQALA